MCSGGSGHGGIAGSGGDDAGCFHVAALIVGLDTSGGGRKEGHGCGVARSIFRSPVAAVSVLLVTAMVLNVTVTRPTNPG